MWWLLVLLWVCSSNAQAAFLRFTIGTSEGPQATPLVKVTVSGVQVFNKRTGSFNIPINTTGQVSIQIVELEQYQRINGWSGVCAGVTQGNCEFSAGQDVTYDAGIGVKNLLGTVRFTSSSADFVRAPDKLSLTVLSGTEQVGVTLEPNVIQPCCNTQKLLIGSYSLRPNGAGSENCLQSSVQSSAFTVAVLEDTETLLDVKYRANRCIVTVNITGDLTRGSVVSAPAGIDCPNGVISPGSSSACAAFFAFQSKVGLRPSPNAGSVFAGWSAGCGSKLEPTCEVVAVPGGAKIASFIAATPGSADLSIVPSSFAAEDAGGGRVKVSFTVQNSDVDPASSVRAQIFSSGPGQFSEIPNTVSDAGDCLGVVNCLWAIGELGSGQSKRLSFTAATTKTAFNLRACTLGSNTDPDQSNNCSSAAVTLGGTPPVPSSLSVVVGAVPPASRTLTKGTGINPALQFTLSPIGGPLTLEGLSLQISGTGDDASDLTSVTLIADTNANGALDAGETIVASGTFPANDGTLTLIPSSLTTLNTPTTYLVAVSVNSSIAGMALHTSLAFSIAALVLIGSWRRLVGVLAVALMLSLTACPNPPTPGAVIRTYQLSLTSVSVTKAGAAITVSGLPVAGATLSVEK